jgi:hypothetical protein
MIIDQILHFPHYFQGQFCKLPLIRVISNRKLGDYCAIRSSVHVYTVRTSTTVKLVVNA